MDDKYLLIKSLQKEGWLKNPALIRAFEEIDRADFVREEDQDEAYGDYPLSIGDGQTISQPLTVAFMLEMLDPQPGEKILDIGSGSGWTTALLAHITSQNHESPHQNNFGTGQARIKNLGRVVGIERISELCSFGQKNLAKYFSEDKAKIVYGDGTLGYPEEAPFDKILAGAAASRAIPDEWRVQLKVGGRIVAPVDDAIYLFIKKSDTEWEEKEFPGFAFVPLIQDKSQKIKDKNGRNGKKPNSKYFFIYCLLFFVFATGAFANEVYFPHASYKESMTVEILPGVGSRKIAETLKKNGVIRSKWVFVAYISAKGMASSLKPGTYIFGNGAIPDIADELVKGALREHSVTIPEGWSLEEIAAYLETQRIISKRDEFLEVASAKNGAELKKGFSALSDKPDNASFEGYLFPDTYRVYENATAEGIITKMFLNFERKLTSDLREAIEKQNKTIFEIIIMASLIEKEVNSEEDRAVVSGILWKRMQMGIPLQVDATIVYITGKKGQKVSLIETKIDSPYNTYKYRGLPIGPISNPGISSIRAAIYPQSSPYLYYLSAPDGKTIFSRILEEHNKAKAKYLR